ncbi:MAG: radical SAM protein [Candidatus Omnitrophota bacterium]|nr:radical SAM protein [Candidatus Omnitrophota bacterium]
MMKVLLINPPMLVDEKPKFPSFGMAYIYHALRSAGYETALLDIDAYRYPKEYVLDFIRANQPDVIGLGGLVTVYPYLAWLVPEARKIFPDIKIALGGPVASSLRERCFERLAVDFIVVGEGELTVVQLLNALQGKENILQVNGIGFKDSGKVIFTEPRPLMPDLSGVPFFDDTIFPMEDFLKRSSGVFQIHVQRGCPSNCTFCFNAFRVVSRKVRYRPVSHILRELKSFKEKYKEKISLFALAGECVTMNREWLRDFSQGLIEAELNINYRVTSRVDTIDEERLEWLRRSGCSTISFGLESGSSDILRIMRKNSTPEKGLRAVHLARKYIPHVEVSIMLGYVGENRKTLDETVSFCKKLGIRPVIFYATPFPGTELYSMALQKRRILDEESYLMGLDKKVISALNLNLTDMEDKDARSLIIAAHKEIERYYFVRSLFNFEVVKNIFYGLAKNGPRESCRRIWRKSLFLLRKD